MSTQRPVVRAVSFVALLAVAIVAAPATARPTKPPLCSAGRWVVAGAPLVAGGTAQGHDVVALAGGAVDVRSGCAAATAKVKRQGKSTLVHVGWQTCGVLSHVRLVAKIAAGCGPVTGTFTAKRQKKRRFTAPVSRCGDGVTDPGRGETCDGADVAGCTSGGTCAASCACTLLEFKVGVDPRNIVAGPDGALWFTECTPNKIGRITTSGEFTEFPVPTADSCPWGITVGAAGVIVVPPAQAQALWFTELRANQIGIILPPGNTVREFPLPTANSGPAGITTRPFDTRLWFTESRSHFPYFDKVGSIDVVTGEFAEQLLETGGDSLAGIAAAPDGTLWFAETSPSIGRIGRLVPDTALDEFALPEYESEPVGITVDGDGTPWFTENAASRIASIDPVSFQFTEHDIPTAASEPVGIVFGPNCSGSAVPGPYIWFAEHHGGKLGCFAAGGGFTEVPVASPPYGITVGPDGNIWFTAPESGRVGRVLTP